MPREFNRVQEISQLILNLAVFMSAMDRGQLLFSMQELGQQAINIKSYAKALHYYELEWVSLYAQHAAEPRNRKRSGTAASQHSTSSANNPNVSPGGNSVVSGTTPLSPTMSSDSAAAGADTDRKASLIPGQSLYDHMRECVQKLIEINSGLQLLESASGMVELFQQEGEIEPLWLEKLGQWDNALQVKHWLCY